MHNYSVVSKGEYVGKQTSEFLRVDRYIIVRRAHKRQLLLELENCSKDDLTALRLQIEQFDARGKFLGVVNVNADDLQIKPGKFVLKKEINLKNTCVDTFVKVLFAEYGDYKYRLGDNETFAVYEKKKAKKEFDDKSVKQELGKKTHVASPRNFNAPILVRILSVIVILVAVLVSYIHLSSFKAGKDSFFINNVEYEFIGADVSDGAPVRVIGYAGFGGSTIVINDEIDGHPVKEIDKNAFENNKYLTSVKIVGDIPIEGEAFRGCRSLKKLVLDGVKKIGNEAFKSCSSLVSVEINNCEEIGIEAFKYCSSLKKLKITNSNVEKELIVGSQAFAETGDYDEISINQFVRYGDNCNYFNGVKSVKKLSLRNYNYTPYENEPVNVNKSISDLFGKKATPEIEELSIGYMDGISNKIVDRTENTLKSFKVDFITNTEIPASTFEDCVSLSTFSMSVPATKVGSRAFRNTRITSFDASKLESIGEQAFEDCDKLETFDLKENTTLTSIPKEAFRSTSVLDSIYIPSSVQIIGENAFEYSGAREVVFDDKCPIIEIPAYAFRECQRLAVVKFNAGMMKIGEQSFANCIALKEIQLPETLVSIDTKAFAYCTALESFAIPNSVNSIGSNVLYGCNAIESLIVPFLGEHMGSGKPLDYLFANSSYYGQNATISEKLTSVTITNDTVVGEGAFYEMKNLKEITISDNTRSIASNAFVKCVNLRYFEIPASIVAIDPYAFVDCYRLFEVKDHTGTIQRGEGAGEYALAVYNYKNADLIQKTTQNGNTYAFADGKWYLIGYETKDTLSITEKVNGSMVVIPSHLFYEESIKEVVIGSGVYKVQDYAFADSYIKKFGATNTNAYMGVGVFQNASEIESADLSGWNLTVLPEYTFAYSYRLGTVSLPNSISNIDECAFYECDSLKNVNFPTKLTIISLQAFQGCDSLASINLPASLRTIEEKAFYYCRSLKSAIIPYGTTTLGQYVFANCFSLSSLVIPTTVSQIGKATLAGCSDIVSVTIPYLGETLGTSETLGRLFGYSYSSHYRVPTTLTTVEITRETMIPNNAFYNCGYIEEVVLPQGAVSIGANAFMGCWSLKKINLPNSISSIGNSAFQYCSSLVIDKMPTSLRFIGSKAFYECQSLTKIEFGNNLEVIGEYAFYMSGLKELTIPSSISYVYDYAFAECSQLEVVKLNSGIRSSASFLSTAFMGCYNLHEVYNLTGRTLTVGSSTFGGVADNAVVIHVSANSPRLKKETVGGLTFKYNDAICALVDYSGYDSKVELKAYTLGGKKVSSYIVAKYVFDGSEYVSELVITDAVKEIRTNAFSYGNRLSLVKFDGARLQVKSNTFAYVSRLIFDNKLVSIDSDAFYSRPTVYYNGSESNWSSNPNRYNVYSPNYYYNECIHSSGLYWNYDEYGSINTATEGYNYRIIKDSTCTAQGTGEYYCDDCGYSSYTTIEKKPHNYGNDMICIGCGKMSDFQLSYGTVNGVKDKIISVQNTEGDTFDIFNKNYYQIRSTSSEIGVSKLVFTAKRSITLGFKVGFSKAGFGEVKVIAPSGTRIFTSTSGTTYYYELKAGEKITIEFNRTSKVTNSYVYLDNITIS